MGVNNGWRTQKPSCFASWRLCVKNFPLHAPRNPRKGGVAFVTPRRQDAKPGRFRWEGSDGEADRASTTDPTESFRRGGPCFFRPSAALGETGDAPCCPTDAGVGGSWWVFSPGWCLMRGRFARCRTGGSRAATRRRRHLRIRSGTSRVCASGPEGNKANGGQDTAWMRDVGQGRGDDFIWAS